MNLLKSYSNEIEAQLLGSRLAEAGIDHKIETEGNDVFNVMIFEDDADEAAEILEALAFEDDASDEDFDDISLMDFDDEDDD
jgi:hypothetical protein